MEICETTAEIRAGLWGKPRIVLVPTMGALHQGHRALLEEARRCAGDTGTVVASIFVNPSQFGPGEDYGHYPRPLDDDKALCEEAGVDLLFRPPEEEIYFPDASVRVNESRLSTHLCGRSRPGHFSGVCTVVLKLFNIVRPEIAVFGKKDYQQLALIRRMVRDLNLEIDIVGVPTVREEDGLAVSSRNIFLSGSERRQARVIAKALFDAQTRLARGERDVEVLIDRAKGIIEKSSDAKIDYLAVVDAEDLRAIEDVEDRAVMATAVYFGKTRLIDNIDLEPPGDS